MTLTELELKKLNDSLKTLIRLPSKDDTEILSAHLRHRAHNFDYDDIRDRESLFRAIAFAESASGSAVHREFWTTQFQTIWKPLFVKLQDGIRASEARPVVELEA